MLFRSRLVIPKLPRCVRIAEFLDGTSQTILVGEKAMSPLLYELPTWYWDEPFFLGGSDSTVRKGRRVVPDYFAAPSRYVDNWGSAHPGGAQFGFADGSLRLLQHGTPSRTVRALLTPRGGEYVDPF